MGEPFSIPGLAEAVNAWCRQHGVAPANGQAAEDLSERSLRYYRTIGLLDPPTAGGGRGYGEKHFLQLVALRLLQARGLPLRRIRELLHGRSLEELRRVREEGLLEHQAAAGPAWQPAPGPEPWRMTPLHPDFLLLSRGGAPIAPETIEAIQRLLDHLKTPNTAS